MTDRYTKKDATEAFDRLMKALGKTYAHADGRYVVGGWALDHNSVYGGYVVHEISNEYGAVREPFGSRRRGAREFCDMVNFLITGLSIATIN